MNNEQLEVFKRLESSLRESNKRKNTPAVDFAMKVATAVSTAGILALFALFTVQIPTLNTSIDKLTWQQEDMSKRIDEFKNFTNKPRFTKEDFLLEMRLYENRLKLLENELISRGGWMDKIEGQINALRVPKKEQD